MAQYLDLNPSTSGMNDRVNFADIILAGEFTILLGCELRNNTNDGFLLSGGTGSTGIELYRRSSGGSNGWQLFVGGASVASNANGSTWPYFDDITPTPRIIEISRDAANLITIKNPAGVVELSHTHAGDVKINNIGARGATFYRGMLLYSLEVTNGAFYRKYDASLPLSAGAVLATNDGLNLGTISGGASFVEFDGGAEPDIYLSTVSANIPLFGSSVAQSSAQPSYSSAVSVGVPLFSVSSSQSAAAPNYDSSVNFGVSMFSAAVSQDYLAPSGGASISFSVPLFGVQSSQQSTVPQYSLSANAGVELFGISAQQVNELPSGGVTVSIGIPMFSATASNSATVPQYNMTASFGVPMFSVLALSGEFNYVATDGGKLDIPALSRQLDIPAQSRRIDL